MDKRFFLETSVATVFALMLYSAPASALWLTVDISAIAQAVETKATEAQKQMSEVESTMSTVNIQQTLGDNLAGITKLKDPAKEAQKKKEKMEKQQKRMQKFAELKKKYDAAKKKYDAAKKKYDEVKKDVDGVKKQTEGYINDAKEAYGQAKTAYEEGKKQVDSAINEAKKAYNDAQEAVNSAGGQIEGAVNTVNEAKNQINNAKDTGSQAFGRESSGSETLGGTGFSIGSTLESDDGSWYAQEENFNITDDLFVDDEDTLPYRAPAAPAIAPARPAVISANPSGVNFTGGVAPVLPGEMFGTDEVQSEDILIKEQKGVVSPVTKEDIEAIDSMWEDGADTSIKASDIKEGKLNADAELKKGDLIKEGAANNDKKASAVSVAPSQSKEPAIMKNTSPQSTQSVAPKAVFPQKDVGPKAFGRVSYNSYISMSFAEEQTCPKNCGKVGFNEKSGRVLPDELADWCCIGFDNATDESFEIDEDAMSCCIKTICEDLNATDSSVQQENMDRFNKLRAQAIAANFAFASEMKQKYSTTQTEEDLDNVKTAASGSVTSQLGGNAEITSVDVDVQKDTLLIKAGILEMSVIDSIVSYCQNYTDAQQ